MSVALRVDNVSKQYRIYNRPADRLKESLTYGRWKWHRAFWALRDVSFEVERGTTTGIIGPNGSGKSTLLQIITGTLEPTHGNVWVDGRIAALLELGAGFNLEFTGIENIFMNAALMGFSRKETEARLPEIARFAEIGDFINQPVKTYSSGMYVRLAFATAVSSDPQILIIDEALSVGDALFQHRCLRRIKQMQENGTTILFVSHDPAAIRELCSSAILLNEGRIEATGKTLEVLNRYQRLIMEHEKAYNRKWLEEESGTTKQGDLLAPDPALGLRDPDLKSTYRHGDGSAEILSAQIIDSSGHGVDLVDSGTPLTVRVRAKFNRDVEKPVVGFLLRNRHGVHAYGANTEQKQLQWDFAANGDVVEVAFDFECWLGSDLYSLSVAVHSEAGKSYDWLDGVHFFRVASTTPLEGIANLNAKATFESLGRIESKLTDLEKAPQTFLKSNH
jgi:ABC-type polysaccharide/polyol phosphate transport system ATPase subunit